MPWLPACAFEKARLDCDRTVFSYKRRMIPAKKNTPGKNEPAYLFRIELQAPLWFEDTARSAFKSSFHAISIS